MSFYKIGTCDYCDEENQILRPSPFLADMSAMMCEYCWSEIKKEYMNSNGEYIPDFDDRKEEYKEIKSHVKSEVDELKNKIREYLLNIKKIRRIISITHYKIAKEFNIDEDLALELCIEFDKEGILTTQYYYDCDNCCNTE
ncbi:TPA: hypothetical protein PTV74_003229 [Clostridium botulinum]|nr:hypothetical protein [Clostridium botulinum]HDK7206384.1 hypothetical protein [Clostridium botulinum]HDK7210120.1 hypothetical protein [Clostridium botulinum]HDK7265569.1 hypothetical protein [Clostridium botulinum]HDK7269417.1 hypothetical protein [Clostridium botulinum]